MKVMVLGASGFVGRNAVVALTLAGHTVKPVSRRNGIDVGTLLSPDNWKSHLSGIDAVINCVGIIGETAAQRFNVLHKLAPIALFNACAQVGVRRVIQVSSLGADNHAFSRYHLSKLAADDLLRSLDLDWFVLRPSLIYGKGGTSTEMFLRLAKLPLIPVIDDGDQPLQPVHISDVVAVVLNALTATKSRQTLDIVSSEVIPYAEWLQLMRMAQGMRRGHLLHIPGSIVLAGLYLARYCKPILHPENLRMLRAGYGADVQKIANFLGRIPKPIEGELFFSDFESSRKIS